MRLKIEWVTGCVCGPCYFWKTMYVRYSTIWRWMPQDHFHWSGTRHWTLQHFFFPKKKEKAEKEEIEFATVQRFGLPSVLPRLVYPSEDGNEKTFTSFYWAGSLSGILINCFKLTYKIWVHISRVMRNADLSIDEDDGGPAKRDSETVKNASVGRGYPSGSGVRWHWKSC